MLDVQKVSFQYNETPVLKNISFTLEKGEHLSIIGESGSGKSTLLKVIYGLYHIEKGKIFWDEKQLLGPNYNIVPGEAFMKYVAQDYDLMPYITVEENIGKFLSNFYPRKKKKRIAELLDVVGMTNYAKVKPTALSGGQQQRVALAKAVAKAPELLLLDEPFSNVDNFKKNKLRRNIFAYLKEQNIACITATHDNADSLSFADSTMVLRHGKMVDKNTPLDLYRQPKNKYVASLFGEVNELPLSLFYDDIKASKKSLLYPHQLKIVQQSPLKLTVKNSYFQGTHYLIKGKLGRRTVYVNHSAYIPAEKEVYITAIEE
ncbi:ABC transporter ATP-binding protein [Galbibacter sp. EGI 63066]|uniref:ABC transporter ATP-binding protein n=1 Tax=Galbibacter sp. EGI 63066 TaxID=2993559 RepID=UPI0022497BC3|nr:ABC transporter ATP-binding protein [Galbibacter sp. EGI 63066]MCX2678966.1 ABC transporter ATP-binding protein [Galbibacter sp. EGI 63066]